MTMRWILVDDEEEEEEEESRFGFFCPCPRSPVMTLWVLVDGEEEEEEEEEEQTLDPRLPSQRW